MEAMTVGYFSNLYKSPDDNSEIPNMCHGGFSLIPSDALEDLCSQLSEAEIWKAINRMGSHKALDIDGFQPVFFKRCWPTVGKSVTLCAGFLQNKETAPNSTRHGGQNEDRGGLLMSCYWMEMGISEE
ncbi:hypothetical protein V2J09_022433 [Rumex salicifolius]